MTDAPTKPAGQAIAASRAVRDLITVQVTVNSVEEAESLSHAVLEARLAACVQVSEITSRYRWKGKVEEDGEFLLVMKTVGSAFDRLAALVEEKHSYDEPEIIALPVIAAAPGYAGWVRRCVAIQ